MFPANTKKDRFTFGKKDVVRVEMEPNEQSSKGKTPVEENVNPKNPNKKIKTDEMSPGCSNNKVNLKDLVPVFSTNQVKPEDIVPVVSTNQVKPEDIVPVVSISTVKPEVIKPVCFAHKTKPEFYRPISPLCFANKSKPEGIKPLTFTSKIRADARKPKCSTSKINTEMKDLALSKIKAKAKGNMLLADADGSADSTSQDGFDSSNNEVQWCFSQVKGALDDDVTEADIVSCVEFNHDGEFLATGDKGGRVVIFQRDAGSKNCIPKRGEYNVYSTFQSHEPEFDYLKSLEIEEKINKIRWLKRKNPAHFLLSTNDKTIKLWRVTEKEWKVEGFNLKEENGRYKDPANLTHLSIPKVTPTNLMVEASLRRVFANAHTYHINSISVNSDQETYLSADDLRINLWNLEITDQSFNIVDIKPANMEELTEVITASEFHPTSCNLFVYSSSKGTIRLCDMREAALCDKHAKLFDEPEDPTNRSFFSEIISSISDVKFSYSGRYMVSRDYLSIKVWDLHMESRPIECYPVHEYLRSKLCSLYENDCIFDKFECCWNGTDTAIMTGSYNNFFRVFDRNVKKDYTLEASRDVAKPKMILKPRKVGTTPKRKKDEIGVDCLDFSKKILHTAWHPKENIIAVAATNNLFIFQEKS